MLRGAVAATVTPLADSGAKPDLAAVPGIVDFLMRGGVDGVLAMGTTGEGILLSVEERKLLTDAFVAADTGVTVAVHVGAQTTADTVALAEHAAAAGVDAVAVIGPPYFAYDDDALFAHFAAAAGACDPVAFYVYEFAARAGYSVPLAVIGRLREECPNLRGLKVSNTPWAAFEPYLEPGLDCFAGPEALIGRAMAAGAAGAVSGLAAAFPEPVVAEVRAPSSAGSEALGQLRASFQGFPFQAALKRALARRGVAVASDVRGPLRGLTDAERRGVDQLVDNWLALTSSQ